LILVVFWNSTEKIQLKWHINPDPTGYAALFGYFNQSFDSKNLENEISKSIPIDPLTSVRIPWGIPDAQLRFAADLGISAGRLSHSGLLSAINQIFDVVNNFWVFWMALAVYGVWLISIVSVSLVRELGQKLNFCVSEFGLYIIGLITCVLPVSSILVGEGISAQLHATAIMYGILYVMVIYSIKKITFERFILYTIVLFYALYFSYPQAYLVSLLIFFPVLIVLAIINFKSKVTKFKIKYTAKSFSLLIIIIPLLFDFGLNSRTVNLTSRGASGNAGGTVNLGFPLISDLLGLGNGTLRFVNQGFSYLNLNFNLMLFQISFLIIAYILSVIFIVGRIKKLYKLQLLIVLTFPVAFFTVSFFVSIAQMKIHQAFNQYFLLRQLHLLLILTIAPIIFVVITKIHIYFKSIRINKEFKRSLGVTLFLIPIVIFGHNSVNTWESYSPNTQNMQYFTKCPKIKYNESIFVSDKPDHRNFHLSLCGSLFYATDDWQPKFPISNDKTWNVFKLTQSVEPKNLGKVVLKQKLETPCNTGCMLELIQIK
jgi:hypothetical protein